jgi:serine/threonine-protein kinase
MATDSDPASRPADASAFLAEVADVRTALDLPVTPLPTRARRSRPVVRETSPDAETTGVIKSVAAPHNTSVVPGPGGVGGRALMRNEDGPPPPVVIPPPKQTRRRLTAQQRRRRRALLIVLALLLAGTAAVLTPLYFLKWRYATVPDVSGESIAQATKVLKDAGYSVNKNVFSDYNDAGCKIGVSKGEVLRTKPSAGTRLLKGKTVTITQSAGPHQYLVPQLRGHDPDAAKTELKAKGINVDDTVKPESSLSVGANKVIRTAPAAGTKVTCKDTITLYVSTGPPIIAVPNIAPGTPVDQARNTLKAKGFKVKIADAQFNDTIPADSVISISPNDKAPEQSTITITPSKGPEFVQVPNIPSGTSTEAAEAALQSVGLKWSLDKHLDGGILDRVVDVNPGPGTRVHSGTTVTLTVV